MDGRTSQSLRDQSRRDRDFDAEWLELVQAGRVEREMSRVVLAIRVSAKRLRLAVRQRQGVLFR